MEKELLKNHVREISKIIFGDLLLNTSVLVNEEKTQKFESKFMCEIELINEEINQNQINKLSKLINKKIHQSSNKIYWFEGGNSSLKEKSFMKPAEDLIKCVDLPVFLDNYIFKKLKAKYAPDHTKFNKNLKHDEVDVQTYLGTYFPRSFAETYSIFNNILLNDIVKKTTRKNKEINILDIGSGTGEINTSVNIPVSINNMESFNGFQLDITLPQDIVYVDNSIDFSGRESDHSILASVIGENTLRILAFSNSNSNFSETSGEVFTFDLLPSVNSGTYPLPISGQVISNIELGNIESESYAGTISINAPNLYLSSSNFNLGRIPITTNTVNDISLSNTPPLNC